MPRALSNRSRIAHTARFAGAAVLVAVLITAGHLAALQITGNFHTVVAGKLYRSAQPTAARIGENASRYHIKTIINLRGENSGAPWYDAEIRESNRLGIAHVDFRMSARQQLTPSEAGQLIQLMDRAEKPILVHCNAGADRSGLASALFVAAIERSGESAAERQLSLRYGHLSLPFIPEYAMNRTFETCQPFLGLAR